VKKHKLNDSPPTSSSDHQKAFVLCELSRLNLFPFRKAAISIDQEQSEDEESNDDEEADDAKEVSFMRFFIGVYIAFSG
jgi:heat shock protein HspQ